MGGGDAGLKGGEAAGVSGDGGVEARGRGVEESARSGTERRQQRRCVIGRHHVGPAGPRRRRRRRWRAGRPWPGRGGCARAHTHITLNFRFMVL